MLVLFVPPWLSSRLTVAGDVTWAKRLDPLAVNPYLVAAARAPTPQAALVPLQAAVRKQPRVVELRFQLAEGYERAGPPRRRPARAAGRETDRPTASPGSTRRWPS